MKSNTILRICGKDYKQNTVALLKEAGLCQMIHDKAVKLFGNGFDDGNMRIGIKPNLVSPSPAQFGSTTHPEIVEGILEYLFENGFRNVKIMEGSWAGDDTQEAFEYCGFNKLAEKFDVPLIDTKKLEATETDCRGMRIRICSCVSETDFLINVPVLKGHCQTKMTCALKNMKGLIPDSEKRRFHTLGLHEPIAHLNTGIHQDFIVVDDICGDPDFEDGGNPINKNCIIACTDPVVVDTFACEELGWDTDDVPYVKIAVKLGVGNEIYPEIIDLTEAPEVIQEENRRILDVSCAIDEVDVCSGCYACLTEALFRLKEEGLLEKLDTKIGIGQGMQEKTGKLGVGNCTWRFEHSIPGCPPEPELIFEELKAYIESHE